VFSNTVFSIALRYHGKWLKLFKIFLLVFCTVIIRYTDTFWSPCTLPLLIWSILVNKEARKYLNMCTCVGSNISTVLLLHFQHNSPGTCIDGCNMATQYWLLQYGCSVLTAAIWLLSIDCCSMVTQYWLLQYGYSVLTAAIWLLSIDCCNMATH
jgi:hypothetical protein